MGTNSGNHSIINTNMNMNMNNNDNDNNSSAIKPPETQYSNKFVEIAKLVAQGKKPDDVQIIDDMPPDPNAPLSESKMAQQKKPFQIDTNQDSAGLSWFEQYESQSQQNNATIPTNQIISKSIDDTDNDNGIKDNNNDNNIVQELEDDDNKSMETRRKV